MPLIRTRRWFMGQLGLAPLAGAAVLAKHPTQGIMTRGQEAEIDRDARLPPELVYRFVRAAHLNFDRTRKMLDEEPLLIRAAWEWGSGDFEMGIDGAAHTGSREIVEFLIERGAPHTVFAAATLGDLNTIKAIVQAHPSIIQSRGPHEIPLIDHAIAGGEAAAPVAEYLRELGAIPLEQPKDLPIPERLREIVAGKYHVDAQGQELTFRIYAEGDRLFIDAGRMGVNRLQFQGQYVFQVEGTPAQLTFDITGSRATGALLREGSPIGYAKRLE